MSRNFEVLQRAEREKEVLLVPGPPSVPWNGQREDPSHIHRIREEITRLVQRLFLPPVGAEAPRVVVFCGVESDAGCGWICASVGRALGAQLNGTVCLVDANLHAPSLHEQFGLENVRGLADSLSQDGPIHAFVQQAAGERVWLLAGGPAAPEALNTLGGERMHARLTELREQFHYVLLLAPPACAYADAMVLGKLADGVVLVVEANATRCEAARQVKESFAAAGAHLLGAVLNERTFPIPERLYRKL